MSSSRVSTIIARALLVIGVLVACELLLRGLLFSGLPFTRPLRYPDLYADPFSNDDYWLLYHRFGGRFKPPSDPHPELGWVKPALDRTTLAHRDASLLAGRRPVLLYGDSFAECAARPCFEDVLNRDAAFSARCFLLNHGVGGYGLDQIYMLMTRTLPHYSDPVVVFSLLTEDLDRTVLSVRVGQKPRFRIENGALRLTGVPIDRDPAAFFERSRPTVGSYLFRMMFEGRVPRTVAAAMGFEEPERGEKIALARALLRQAIADLRQRNLAFVFVVFVGNWRGRTSVAEDLDWRLETIVEVLEAERVRYVTTKDIIREDMRRTGRAVPRYFIPDDGHYLGETNVLVARALQQELGMCRAE